MSTGSTDLGQIIFNGLVGCVFGWIIGELSSIRATLREMAEATDPAEGDDE